MKRFPFRFSSLVCAMVLAFACACDRTNPPGRAEEHEQGEHEEHRIALTEEQWKAAGIQVAAAGPGVVETGLSLLGEVVPNGDHLAHIVPRFPGVARDVRKKIGDPVRKGEILAVLESNDSLTPYNLISQIDGTVISRHITLGEALQGEEPSFTVADLSTVWVDLSIYPKDLGAIRKGQHVRVHGDGEGLKAEGALSYVSPVLDETTRTALARLVLPNPEGRWRPGMFVTAHVVTGRREAPLAVPSGAIQTLNGRPTVFIEEEGEFEPREVRLGETGEAFAEILEGLKAGEPVAVQGTFFLKSEAGKESMGEGHSH